MLKRLMGFSGSPFKALSACSRIAGAILLGWSISSNVGPVITLCSPVLSCCKQISSIHQYRVPFPVRAFHLAHHLADGQDFGSVLSLLAACSLKDLHAP